jgi:ribonuclease BN (tRNA processing enzyme)
MRLTVLGGASAAPNTRQGCSGYLVAAGATRVVLDLGPGTLPELRAHADFRKLDAVILSHLHIDHCLDLFALYWALCTNLAALPGPTPVWLPPGGAQFVRDGVGVLAPEGVSFAPIEDVFELAEYNPDGALGIAGLTVTFQPTSHYIPCWAMRVEDGEGRALVYTADTGPEADLLEFTEGAQTLVAEAMLLDTASYGDGFRGSSTAAEAAALARDASVDTLILTHISEERGHAAARAQAAAVFPAHLEVAMPGLSIEW